MSGELVLLADDEPSVRRAAQRVLERGRYVVYPVADGRQLLDLYAELQRRGESVYAVVADNNMPVMNGIDAARKMREDEFPTGRIILMSGRYFDVPEDVLRTYRVDLLEKPFSADALLRMLSSDTPLPAVLPTEPSPGQ